jgi:hypothetical protein
MSHFAKVNLNKIVEQVIVAEQDFVDTLPGIWIQTSYNTHGGVHLLGGTPLRKNYAAIGYTYDVDKDAFISPKPYNSWILNEETCLWEAPVAKPEGNYVWDESIVNWVDTFKIDLTQ